MNRTTLALLLASLAFGLVSCGSDNGGDTSSEQAEATETTQDITAEKEAYYAANPDFFGFKTPDDIPADLLWENGSELHDIGSPEAKKGGTLYSSISDFPRTLRIVGPDSNGSFRPYILDDVDLPLARRHPDSFVHHPELADSWALSKDEKTVYVKLKKNARWSDGEPVTSDDMMFMFFFYHSEYILAPWYNSNYKTRFTNISRYDDHTISISLPEAKPNSRHRGLDMRPLPEHFFKELGDDYVERYQWQFKPTTGPYVIKPEDIKKGRSITLTRLKDWWGKDEKFLRNRYNFDRIHLSVIRDTAKRFEAFRRGDLDQFGLNLSEFWYDKLGHDDPDVTSGYIHKTQFYNQRPRPTYGLWMNTARPHLDNLDVRVGIQHASNWQLVIDKFFRGDYVRMNSSHDGYGEWTNPDIKARPFDLELATAAFARAGFNKRGSDGIFVNCLCQSWL
jgi:microcin C transport system substrate-binding protein